MVWQILSKWTVVMLYKEIVVNNKCKCLLAKDTRITLKVEIACMISDPSVQELLVWVQMKAQE